MSRGLGFLEVRMLHELERGHASVAELCERMWSERPIPESHFSAARRAMRGLVKRGLVADIGWPVCRLWFDAQPTYRRHFALISVPVSPMGGQRNT